MESYSWCFRTQFCIQFIISFSVLIKSLPVETTIGIILEERSTCACIPFSIIYAYITTHNGNLLPEPEPGFLKLGKVSHVARRVGVSLVLRLYSLPYYLKINTAMILVHNTFCLYNLYCVFLLWHVQQNRNEY